MFTSKSPNVTKITIPSTMKEINRYMFEGYQMKSENFVNNSELDETTNSFWGAMVYDTYKNGFYLCNNVIMKVDKDIPMKFEWPEGIVGIGDNAFRECSNIKRVTVPDGVKFIGNHAFYRCVNLLSLVLPESVESIGDEVVGYDSSLLGDTSWFYNPTDYELFTNNYHFSNIQIGKNCTKIGENLLGKCTKSDIYGNSCKVGKIKGYSNSYAKEYADKNEIEFLEITE